MGLRRSRRRAQETTREQESRRAIAELTASRRVIAEAYEVERHRIERDLHDGTQQYLVAALMQLGEAQLSPTLAGDAELSALVGRAKDTVAQALGSLRATVQGLNPRTLTDLGLEAAVREVATNAPAQVDVKCPHPLPPLPESVMAAAYFFVSEAVTNVVKHAPGAAITILLVTDSHLLVSVVDDGPGGAEILPGHGLAGMRERLAAFGGELAVASFPGGPTRVAARLPLLLDAGHSAIVLHPQEPR